MCPSLEYVLHPRDGDNPMIDLLAVVTRQVKQSINTAYLG